MSTEDGGLGHNTAVMAAGTAVSRVLGVVRNSVTAVALGLTFSLVADTFALANWLPNMLYMLIAGGVLNAVLVPQVVRAYRSANGQDYVDRLLSLSAALLFGVTALLTLAAPLIIRIAASDKNPSFIPLATAFAFWLIPQVFFYGMYTLLGQVLNARGNYGPYMWAPVLNNVIAIIGLVVYITMFGAYEPGEIGGLADWSGARMAVLAGSTTLGVIAQAVVLLIPLYRSGFRFHPRRDWKGTGLGTAGRVAGWTFAALAVGQVGTLAITRVASGVSGSGEGIAGNAAYSNAFLIFMLPHSLITVSLLTAMFTRLSDHAAARNLRAVREDFSSALRTISVFTLFAAVGLSVLALPLVRVLFPSVSAASAGSLAPIIIAFMVGLVPFGAWSLCQRVFYAYEDAKGLFWIQVAMAGIVVTGTFLGHLFAEPRWQVAIAAVSMSASYTTGAIWGGAQVWRRLRGGASRIIRLFVRAGLAAAVAGTLGVVVSRLFGDLSRVGFLKAVVVCGFVGAIMLGTYMKLLRLLDVSELDALIRPLTARVRRTMGTPASVITQGSVTHNARPQLLTRMLQAARLGGDRLNTVIGRGTLLAGRYRLHQQIGIDLPGAESWTARDQILDRPVRALILRSGNVAAAQDAARRAVLVTDPRLLKVLDVGDHEGVAYAVTEPVIGQNLAQLTAHGPLPADQARAIVGEAASALEVARRRGLHHLALRPSVLNVSPDGSVVVSGMALDGELLGRTSGDTRTTSRADTVGLVALLYLALTGRWPETAGLALTEGVEVAPLVKGAPVPPSELNSAVPNDLDTLCAVTLGPNVDGPRSPAELVRDLEPWGAVDVQVIYEGLDASEKSATVPSGPWGGNTPEPATVRRSTRGTPQVPTSKDTAAGKPPTVRKATPPPHPAPRPMARGTRPVATGSAIGAAAAADSSATAAPQTPSPAHPAPATAKAASTVSPAAAPRPRQSIRQTLGELPPTVSRPGTPPPAVPANSAYRTTAAATSPRLGAPAAVSSVPPTPAPVHHPRPADGDFNNLIGRPSSVPEPRSAVDPTPIVLGVVGIIVVVGLFLAAKSFFAPAAPLEESTVTNAATEAPTDVPATSSSDPTTAADPTTEPTTGATTPPVIASAQMLDPPPAGDNNEHPEAVGKAIDGDPTTFWFTRTFATSAFGGIKPGIGYAVTLAESTTVSTVTLLVNGSGGAVEVRATDPSTPTEGAALASGPLSSQTVLTFDKPTKTQTIVLWFTSLPQTPDGKNRLELLEVQVS